MTDDVVIRGFRSDDLEVLQAITVDAFEPVSIDKNMEDLFGPIGGHDWKWRKAKHIAEDCQRDPDGVFVAEVGGRVVGYITTWMDREAAIGHIPNLALDRALRGQGLGRRLIQHAMDYFRACGMSHARIETLDQNPVGQTLYPSLGFQEVARQIHYCADLQSAEKKQG